MKQKTILVKLQHYFINKWIGIDKHHKIMQYKQLAEILHKIRSNCQYLSHIKHRGETNQQFRSQNLSENQLCNISVAKAMIQATYLLYTCSLLKTDIFLSAKPIYYKKNQSSLYQLYLIFYLSQEQALQNQNDHRQNQNEFLLLKAHLFSRNVIQFLPHIFSQVKTFLAEKPLEQSFIQSSINKLIQFIKKFMEPKVMGNPDFPLIKHIQSTELFLKCSDLLLAFKGSLFYQIKKKDQIVSIIKHMKRNMQNKIYYLTSQKNSHHIYKIIDNFLLQLINNEILSMEKSSTRDDKSLESFLVGYLNKINENGKQFEKYSARFYSLDSCIGQQFKTQEEIRRIQKNIYTFEFSVQNFTICVRYITFLEANSESIDIISSYCANVAYQDNKILLETVDLVRNPIKNNQTKKYIVFKTFFRLQKSQEPLTKLLVALEHVTICARLYLQLIIKKPGKDQTSVIQEYSKRLDHLLKLFVNKADNFYKNL